MIVRILTTPTQRNDIDMSCILFLLFKVRLYNIRLIFPSGKIDVDF